MSNVTLIDTQTQFTLAPGKSLSAFWKHLQPDNSVWTVNAVPLVTNEVVNDIAAQQNASLEVVRQWRTIRQEKVTVAGSGGSLNQTVLELTREFHYEIKNVGTLDATFVIFLSVVS